MKRRGGLIPCAGRLPTRCSFGCLRGLSPADAAVPARASVGPAPGGLVPDRDAAGFADARGEVRVPCARADWRRPAGVPGHRGERRVRAGLAAPGRLRPAGVAVFGGAGGPPLSLTRAVLPRFSRKGAGAPAAGGGHVAGGY